jgi:hypothetical protein
LKELIIRHLGQRNAALHPLAPSSGLEIRANSSSRKVNLSPQTFDARITSNHQLGPSSRPLTEKLIFGKAAQPNNTASQAALCFWN